MNRQFVYTYDQLFWELDFKSACKLNRSLYLIVFKIEKKENTLATFVFNEQKENRLTIVVMIEIKIGNLF